MTKLQSDHSTILLRSQSNYNKCQTSLLEENQSYVKTITKLKMHADQNERTLQHSVQHYLNESIQSYNVTNEALVLVYKRFKAEVEKYESMVTNAQTSLSECRQSLENNMEGVEQCESMINNTQTSLTTCQERLEIGVKQYDNCRITLEDRIIVDTDRADEYKAKDDELQSLRTEAEKYDLMMKNAQTLLSECQQSFENMAGVEQYELMMNHTQSSLTKCQEHLENMIKEDAFRTEEFKARDDELKSLRRELELAEVELERRDIERAECDVLYRDLTKARMQNKGE